MLEATARPGRTRTILLLGCGSGTAGALKVLVPMLPTVQGTGPTADVWRIVMVERNSHRQHPYVFPRLAVLPGHAHKGLIPQTHLFEPNSPHLFLHAQVVGLERTKAKLSRAFPTEMNLNGREEESDEVAFDYLLYGLGAQYASSVDTWLGSTYDALTPLANPAFQGTKAEGIAFLERSQERIKAARHIVVVGGGALGIQLATDIASVYPGEKDITLIHSRMRLIPTFAQGVHDEALKEMLEIGITPVLGERLATPEPVDGKVKTSTGREIECDLLLMCTGQKPHVSLMTSILPDCLEKATGLIRLLPTMQVDSSPSPSSSSSSSSSVFSSPALSQSASSSSTPSTSASTSSSTSPSMLDSILSALSLSSSPPPPREADPSWAHVFACGDCANVPEIKSGNRAWFQAQMASKNILRLIHQGQGPVDGSIPSALFDPSTPLEEYAPRPPAIKLTLGLRNAVAQREDGEVFRKTDGEDDVSALLMWPAYNAPTDDLWA